MDYISFLKETDAGVITDALVNFGIGGWPLGVHPTNPKMKVAGRAFTIRYDFLSDMSQMKYSQVYELFKFAENGDVIVVSSPNRGAISGDNIVHAAQNHDFGGYVTDGVFRDYLPISEMTLPTFCAGRDAMITPKNYKPVEYGTTVTIGGAKVNPGDYIVGDYDGIIIIPGSRIDDVVRMAEKIIPIEKEIQKSLNNNCSMDVFKKLAAEKGALRL